MKLSLIKRLMLQSAQSIKSSIKLKRAKFDAQFLKNRLVQARNERKIILFGIPIHGNIGDHLLAEAESIFLKKYVPEFTIFEIPLDFYEVEKQFLFQVIRKDDLILISGGGWLGSLWPYEEKIVHEICSYYKNNMIVVFPQTIYYESNSSDADKFLNDAKEIYKQCKNLTLILREKKSYDFARNNFNCNTLLLPDMALTYRVDNISVKNNNMEVVLCLRRDREKQLTDEKREYLNTILSKFRIIKIDTVINGSINPQERKKYINNICNVMKSSNLVITDRLHGMLMAVISGIPCIAIDNKTAKVKNVYETWLKDNKNVLFLNDLEELDNYVSIMLKNTHYTFDREQYTQLLIELGEKIRKFLIK